MREARACILRVSGRSRQPVLSSMRFRRGLLTASDRHLATYFRYIDAFPCFAPPT